MKNVRFLCTTIDDTIEVQRYMFRKGMLWSGGRSYLTFTKDDIPLYIYNRGTELTWADKMYADTFLKNSDFKTLDIKVLLRKEKLIKLKTNEKLAEKNK